MASKISPQAQVSPNAKIGDNCEIFPFVYIEDDVVIGDNCVIFPFVSILNGTRMGAHNKVHQGSVIAALPQDFNFKGEKSELVIGDYNVIRENVVINRATHNGDKTVIGDRNFLMEGAHVSHDTVIGNDCVLGYGVKVAGDCQIDDFAILSSSVIVNARVHIGKVAMLQSTSTTSNDVPPYIIAGGNPIEYRGVNNKVLTNHNIEDKIQRHIANAYRLLFHGQTSAFDATLQIKQQVPSSPEIDTIIEFLETTKQGIITKK